MKNSPPDFDIDTRGRSLFLALSGAALAIIILLSWAFWLFISPRVNDFGQLATMLSYWSIRIFYIFICFGFSLILLTCYLEKNFLIAKFAIKYAIRFLFPLTILLGRMLGISKNKVRNSFVYVNNSFIKASKPRYKATDVLILLPHCLQNTRCKHRITTDINNCTQCGACDISKLKDIAKRHQVHLAIATGGTLARRIIVKTRPQFIIAVACQRDLVEGMRDVFPLPVYGVFNSLPEGPCINTRVVTKRIDGVLNKVLANTF